MSYSLRWPPRFRRFYPRIIAIDLLPLRGGLTPLGTGAKMPIEVATALRRAARTSKGELKLVTVAAEPGVYHLVKRSPNSDAAVYALALKIDAAALIASDGRFWTRPAVNRSLRMPDRNILVGGVRLIRTRLCKDSEAVPYAAPS